MMQIILQAQAFFPKETLFMMCTRVKGGRRSTRPDFSHTLPCVCALYVSPQVFRYITQLCARACSRPSRRFRWSFETGLFSTDLLPFSFRVLWWASVLVNACQGSICHWQLNSLNLLLLPPRPPFLSYCSSLSSIAGSTHWTATGWSRPCSAFCVTSKSDRVSCLSAALFFSKMLQAGAATVWCLGRQRT